MWILLKGFRKLEASGLFFTFRKTLKSPNSSLIINHHIAKVNMYFSAWIGDLVSCDISWPMTHLLQGLAPWPLLAPLPVTKASVFGPKSVYDCYCNYVIYLSGMQISEVWKKERTDVFLKIELNVVERFDKVAKNIASKFAMGKTPVKRLREKW